MERINKFFRITYGRTGCVTLHDDYAGKRYRAGGGGYDKLGAVVGDWLGANFQAELVHQKPHNIYPRKDGEDQPKGGLYALSHIHGAKGTRASVDGSCGIESVRRIAEAIGLDLRIVDMGKHADVMHVRSLDAVEA